MTLPKKEESYSFLQTQYNLLNAEDEHIVDGKAVRINFTAKSIYSYLRGFTHNSGQEYAHPSQDKVAKMFSCTERSIRTHLKNLEKIGAIRIERGKDGKGQEYFNNRYYVNEFPGVELAPKNHKWGGSKSTYKDTSNQVGNVQWGVNENQLVDPDDVIF